MTVQEAYEIIKARHEDMKVLECIENETLYAFSFVPLDFDEENDRIGGGYDIVNKETGETTVFSIPQMFEEFSSYTVIDIKTLI